MASLSQQAELCLEALPIQYQLRSKQKSLPVYRPGEPQLARPVRHAPAPPAATWHRNSLCPGQDCIAAEYFRACTAALCRIEAHFALLLSTGEPQLCRYAWEIGVLGQLSPLSQAFQFSERFVNQLTALFRASSRELHGHTSKECPRRSRERVNMPSVWAQLSFVLNFLC